MPDSPPLFVPRVQLNSLAFPLPTLAKLRLRGDGPPFVKLGPRAVGYLLDALQQLLAARTRRSTIAMPGAALPRNALALFTFDIPPAEPGVVFGWDTLVLLEHPPG